MAGRQPFAGEPRAFVVLPAEDPTLGGEAKLLELERAEFEAQLGTKVEITTSDPGEGARWLLAIEEDHNGPATIAFDPESRLIVSRAPDVPAIFDSLSLFQTVVRAGGGTIAVADCVNREAAIDRVSVEVADTYPSFGLRGLDWSTICARHVDAVRIADEPLPAFQRWLAELQDGHTWAWEPTRNLPYAVRVAGGEATFVRVREETAGYCAGVRVGWRLVEADAAPVDADGWLERAAGPPHSRPLIAGRRLLAGRPGEPRALTAVSPDGIRVAWEEPGAVSVSSPVTSLRLDSGVGYLRIDAWLADSCVDEAIDEAFDDHRRCKSLILDLRGNPGGNLVLASRTRDRFLRETTALGSIRYSIGGGALSEPASLIGEPASPERRWPGRLVVLTDPLTFSASEDFLLGLQGLEHVTVVGEPTGGGSGRARALRLLPGLTLTVSSALTYDRTGRCVEGAGIPVDLSVVGTDDEVLAGAESL